jgi:hypothetical protein
VAIKGYVWVSQRNNRRDTENATSRVAIYLTLQSGNTCRPTAIIYNSIRRINDIVGDVYLIEVTVDFRVTLVPVIVYKHTL